MTKEELQALSSEFHSTPRERLSQRVKDILDNGNAFIDTHCHIFDNKCTPFGKYIDASSMDTHKSKRVQLKRDINDFFKLLVKESSREILIYYYENFYNINTDILVPLMVDLDKGWVKHPEKGSIKSIGEQIVEIKNIMNDFPIIPFLAVDPHRTKNEKPENDLYANFHKAFTGKNKFFGIKIYPGLGYTPSDDRLDPIYSICNAYDIPVTTHCGTGLIHTRKHFRKTRGKAAFKGKIIPKDYSFYKRNGKRKPFRIIANELNHPDKWEPVLEQYQNLKINFGHYGGKAAWDAYINYPNSETNRVAVINSFAKKYKNRVFADVSTTFTKGHTFQLICDQFNREPIIKDILMYGSDIHVILPFTDFCHQLDSFKKISGKNMELLSVTNPRKFLGI